MRYLIAIGLLATVILGGSARAQAPHTAPPSDVLCGMSRNLGPSRSLVVDLLVMADVPRPTPSPSDIAAVRAAGGRILDLFHVAVVRARLDTAALRKLLSGPGAVATVAYRVRDTTRLDVRAEILMWRGATAADDSALRTVIVRGEYPAEQWMPIHAMVPDSIIPRIAALHGVALVRAALMTCGSGGEVGAQPGYETMQDAFGRPGHAVLSARRLLALGYNGGVQKDWLIIETRLPGFGGLSRDSTGNLRVYLENLADSGVARSVLASFAQERPDLFRRPLTTIHFVRGDFAFSELVSWTQALIPRLGPSSGLRMIGADEELNRVRIGVGSVSNEAPILRQARALGIPDSAIAFELMGEIRLLARPRRRP